MQTRRGRHHGGVEGASPPLLTVEADAGRRAGPPGQERRTIAVGQIDDEIESAPAEVQQEAQFFTRRVPIT